MPLVSIIVPVFNAEHTLKKCLDSILRQNFRDFEVILMDDGSTDGSGAICDEYAKKDGRVRVFHKENTGVSDTRNIGISMASGEYLQFADSDDWVVPDATEAFVRAATEYDCDMVIADFYRVIGDRASRKGNIEENGVLKRVDFAVKMIRNPADFYYGVLWNKLYKRSLIEQFHLRMDPAVDWCEDFIFNLEYIRHADKIYALKMPIYYYVKNKGSLVEQSLSVRRTIQMKRRVFVSYNDFYKDVLDDEDYEKRKLQVYKFLFDAASDGSVVPLRIMGSFKIDEPKKADGVKTSARLQKSQTRERATFLTNIRTQTSALIKTGKQIDNKTEEIKTGKQKDNKIKEVKKSGKKDNKTREVKESGKKDKKTKEVKELGKKDNKATEVKKSGIKDNKTKEVKELRKKDYKAKEVKELGKKDNKAKEAKVPEKKDNKTKDEKKSGKKDAMKKETKAGGAAALLNRRSL